MEKICSNCNYFKPYKYNSKFIFGICNCNKFKRTFNDEEKPMLEGIFRYWDYDQYNSDFDVEENFGCIYFQEKNIKK